MKTRPWYRAWPETAALLFGIGWIPFLPRKAVLAMSRGIGRIGFRFSKKLKAVALANLEVAFGDRMSRTEKETVIRECYQHFALLVLDIIWFSFNTRKRLNNWVVWSPSTDVMFLDEPQLIHSAHYGNWEIIGQAYAAKGQPIFSVAAPLKNKPVDKIFIHLRQKTGQVIIPQQGAARKLLQGLRQRRKLAVLIDQNMPPRKGGHFVDVMGLPAPVSTAPAALAMKTGAEVVTVMAVPDHNGLYTITVHDTLRANPDTEDPVIDLTQRMIDSVADIIRSEPRYWCWMYTRWGLVPEDRDPATYPWYARPAVPGDFKRN
ncbi:MAG: hypothetical protein PF795_11915 [Kiritimatiellae bacterium]|jgi:KDO2-lipid IV(A) lauroyltransferase|nr:hypothetical protein [Kiritimatiellia bacterium]